MKNKLLSFVFMLMVSVSAYGADWTTNIIYYGSVTNRANILIQDTNWLTIATWYSNEVDVVFSVTASDGITIGTNSTDRLFSVDSTVARDSDITSVSNSFVAADSIVTLAYIAADEIVLAASVAADTVVSNALQSQITTLDGLAIKKDGSVTWTGADDHGAQDITNAADIYMTGNLSVGSNVVASTLSVSDRMCEMDFVEGASQDFTSTFSQITNFVDNIVDAGFSSTHSEITVINAGRYTCGMNLSFQNNGAGQFECYLYTNGVPALSLSGEKIGWDRSVGASATDGTIACRKTITLPAGTEVSWWIETGANETTMWDHGTIWVERK